MSSANPQFFQRQTGLMMGAGLAILLLLAAGWWKLPGLSGQAEKLAATGTAPENSESTAVDSGAAGEELIEFPEELWSAAAIQFGAVMEGTFAQSIELTGKIALNEDHVAHIYPLVEGRVDEVKVRFGDRVKQGDVLVVVQSKEVGQTMMQLYQDRLQLEFAMTKDRWTQTMVENTQAMLKLIRAGAAVEEIEEQLANRPMGNYRDQLMTAYINYYRAHKNHSRLSPLSQDGVVTGRQLLEAESEWNLTRASLQSLLEQVQQNIQQEAIVSGHTVKEWQTRVTFHETTLKILGFDDQRIAAVNPLEQGEAISHYEIVAPFDGTIITKDVVLLERVGPENQILSIADLSTVWIATDVYEEHLPLLEFAENQTLLLRSGAFPGRTFSATVFYTGDVVQEATRTISMRAIADNQEGLLKPGLFVNVEFPRVSGQLVVQVPRSALLEHEGKTFVFVHQGADQFERRDVKPGRHNAESTEILAGLKPGEKIVISGGFALKSQMLAELLSE